MAVIHVDGRDVLLEITDRCRTGCNQDYCYKKFTVSPSGAHVPIEVLESRLEWIKKFTDATAITLLGGEPWLHTRYVEICKMVLNKGFRLDVITSAVIGRQERDNYEYSLELYEAGLLDISLTYHAGRNHHQFATLVRDLQNRVEKRWRNLVRIGRDPMPEIDLLCMWVVSRHSNLDKPAFFKTANSCFELVNLTALGDDDEDLNIAYRNYVSQFLNGKELLNFSYMHNPNRKLLRVKFTIRGQQDINLGPGGPVISTAEVGVCGAIESQVREDYVSLDSVIIRTDGGVSFAEAHCVGMTHPLIVVDPCQTDDQVYTAISGSLKQIKNHVFLYNRLKAKESCGESGPEQECKDCPFSRMCTPCWQTVRPWEKETEPSI